MTTPCRPATYTFTLLLLSGSADAQDRSGPIEEIESPEVIIGRLLNHGTFTVQLLDLGERLRSFRKADLREQNFEDLPMPSCRAKLSEQEIADLVSYLASRRACSEESTDENSNSGVVGMRRGPPGERAERAAEPRRVASS
jgi:hypothetical protein